MERFPELGELAEVDAHVAVLVSGVDESLRLGIRHLSAHLADESDELLGGDHAVAVSIEQFECLEKKERLMTCELYSSSLTPCQRERKGCYVMLCNVRSGNVM